MKTSFKHIAIIGVGLMGGSLALALKKRGYKGRITGIGRKKANLIRAKKMGMIDNYSTSYAEGVRDADLIVLAVPVGHFESIVRSVKQNIKKGAIVTDVGSVKARIVEKLPPLMPDSVHFVGAHPIAGKECSGIECATAELYKDAQCIITPVSKTNKTALKKIINLWKSLGAKTVIMAPEEHDMIFGAVSHLPHVVAYALINSIMKVNKNILHNGGRGLKDMTRIALSSSELWRDICAYNQKHLLRALKNFSGSISRMTKLIEKSDWSGLEKEFRKANEARQIIE